MTLPAHPTCGCEELAPETSLMAKSHRPGRVQLRPGQLTEAQPSLETPVLFFDVGDVVDEDVEVWTS